MMDTKKRKSLWILVGATCVLLLGSPALDRVSRAEGLASLMITGSFTPPLATASGGVSFFDNLMKVYVPRRMCMFSEGPVIWLHVISDLLITLSYYSIPFALIYFVRRRRDVAFGSLFWMFAAFILACGTTHLFGAIDIWRPYYRLDGIVKAITAAISIVTAIALWRIMPQLLSIPSAAKLEMMVSERTAELTKSNADRDRLLQAAHAARAEAEHANRLKDQFLATLSHELRTPLNAILGWSQILRATKTAGPDLEEGLTVIERNARAQTKLIAELLDMSQILSGKLKLEIQKVDLAAVVQATMSTVRPSAEAKGIHLECVVSGTLDPLLADAARLEQVFWNILSNSVKFTPNGGTIKVVVSQTLDRAQIVITDNGQGIAADFIPHIFERFRQADGSISRRHGGLGLGLAIAKSIVDAHGGTILAQSPGEGQGATFTVSLPVVAIQMRASSIEPHASSREGGLGSPRRVADNAHALNGVKVLIVDDEPDSVDFVAKVMADCGATVLTASSGEQAFQLLLRERPDVLISDIGMPDEDGYHLMRRIRALSSEQGGRIPAAAVTAYAGPEDQLRARDAGFESQLSKPVEPADLVATAVRLAAKSRAHPRT